MGFSKKIKEQVLVDTARHCCVCHRYKGVKVEVHHITQEALGGDNTYDNAISLCFDCHCDAGHYNPKHPRGTRFSPAELKKAKENWIHLVRGNNIREPTEPDDFLCQYFVCENYENLVEINGGDFSQFPLDNLLIVKNDVLNALDMIIQHHPTPYRHANAWGEHYEGLDSYLEKHPDAIATNPGNKYPYFEVVRTPTRKELENLSNQDGVLKLMLESDIPNESISLIGCYMDRCGGVRFQEEYLFRRLWCAFLAITNVSSQHLALDVVDARQKVNTSFVPFEFEQEFIRQINLPKVPLKPGTTAIIPIAVILPPLYSLARENWSSTASGGYSEQVQVVTHGGVTEANLVDTYIYGDAISPVSIRYKRNGNIYFQEMHSFDLTNMYSIDRHWECGSCPHLFFVEKELVYKRELLAHCENATGQDEFMVPENVESVIIAEIEDETTQIDSIYVNNHLYLTNLSLSKHEYIEIPITGNSQITIIGQYIPDHSSARSIPHGKARDELVRQFMHSLARWSGNTTQGSSSFVYLHR